MSDEAARLAKETARDKREGILASNRIRELHEKPLKGSFDLDHLKAVHAYIFQDLPHRQPGVVRKNSDGWNKARDLEGRGPSHVVRYLHKGVASRIKTVLQQFGGPPTLRSLPTEQAAARLATLYGDLDHAHGFYEGNSRTLREFTRELALEAGHELNWIKTGVGSTERNRLYIARDVAVLERIYPGLTEERAMATNDRAKYEAFFALSDLRRKMGEHSLEAIIRKAMTPDDRPHSEDGQR